MIVISNQAHLQALGIAASFAVALPDAVCTQKTRVPYVLCLHDYGQNADRLLRMLACDALVDTQNIGLLIPDGQNSCFLDMAYGPHWESYLMNELLPYAQRTFPLQNTPRVFGVGTGGWAAARLAAAYPDRFAASAAANARPDLPALYAQGKLSDRPDLEAAFGDPQRLQEYPVNKNTVWLEGANALQVLYNNDWSTPA
ncbi:MAG TPA: alpha/beta hydrolase-fold protein [Candidatus Limiplasma sp.]|nr:alpha/beta hydrolase-fold protein [Candidatus Limiplasma sp.]HRX09591.1 alpha/beta hydrolase-fold protein [Candidatus Limiplasma sp.]